MKNSVQFITHNAGVRTGVIMSVAEYERLLSLAYSDDDFEASSMKPESMTMKQYLMK
ncbi:hypothetical protein ACLB1N_22180 [Escherichia coli]